MIDGWEVKAFEPMYVFNEHFRHSQDVTQGHFNRSIASLSSELSLQVT